MPINVPDKIYRFVKLENWEHELTKTPEMQRTRGIKQLGLSYIRYPSATHTRYEHSLGVAHLMGLAIDQIANNSPRQIAEEIQEYHNCLRATAILHDCGHTPFSHTLDGLIEMMFGKSHEVISAELVQSSSKISSILEKNNGRLEDVLNLLLPSTEFPISYIQEIVSGDIDVDRIDYLNRDSHYTMTGYGVIDYRGIIDSMSVKSILPEEYDKTAEKLKKKLIREDKGIEKLLTEITKTDTKLGEKTAKMLKKIDEKAIKILRENHIVLDFRVRHSAIGLLMAREVMYPLVYRHPETRAAEGIFNKIIEYCIEKGLIKPEIFYDPSTILENCEKSILINDGYLDSMVRNINDNYVKDMIRRLDSEDFFRVAFEATYWDVGRLRHAIKDIIYSSDQKKRYVMIKGLLNGISSEIGLDPKYITIDILQIKEEKGLVNALIQRPDGRIVSISEASSITQALRNSPLENWFSVVRIPEKLDGKQFAYSPKIREAIADLFFID